MNNYQVMRWDKDYGSVILEVISADEFMIDSRGDLSFLVYDGDTEDIIAFFAQGEFSSIVKIQQNKGIEKPPEIHSNPEQQPGLWETEAQLFDEWGTGAPKP